MNVSAVGGTKKSAAILSSVNTLGAAQPAVANGPRFEALPPACIVPVRGRYPVSESSFAWGL